VDITTTFRWLNPALDVSVPLIEKSGVPGYKVVAEEISRGRESEFGYWPILFSLRLAEFLEGGDELLYKVVERCVLAQLSSRKQL
jgi:hypothetical protein